MHVDVQQQANCSQHRPTSCTAISLDRDRFDCQLIIAAVCHILHKVCSLLQTPIEMLSTDLVGELRAEVTRWWETVQLQHQKNQEEQLKQQQQDKQSSSGTGSALMPILGAMLGDGPMRMITLGQELSVDLDEKTLSEMQLKDSQVGDL